MQQFQAESKRLLELMINSIYTHKEIFLRELISNASDAIDKCYYKSLTDENVSFHKDDFFIRITLDKDNRSITISDTGIGMNKNELEDNLGVIAKSGSLDFKNNNESRPEVEIIGQFGVGFYSAFMVAKKVVVRSRTVDSEQAFEWTSSGVEGFTIQPCEKAQTGTDIIIFLKDDSDDENYSEFLQEYRIKNLVKKYSDFVKFPIKMLTKKSRPKKSESEDPDAKTEYEDYFEDDTLNSMVPIWRKNKNELTAEDYHRFYQDKHFGFDKPISYIHSSVDGITSYTALLFIPASAPYNFYSKEFQKGLELYSSGVLIMDKCADLLPDYFGFVQGLVDSADLSLNISREMLQHDRQLKFIAKKLKDKIKSELLSLLRDDRDKYESFFKEFGRQLKYGLYSDWGSHKEDLQDLLLFFSTTENKLVSLEEYLTRMKPEQKYIYYATGETPQKIKKLPQAEMLSDKGFEILCFTEDVDEFSIKMLSSYKEKEFKSISSGDLDIEDSDANDAAEDYSELFGAVKEAIGDKLKEVRQSKRLKTHPVCLTSEGELSIEMEKVLSSMPNNPGAKAEKILEINTSHKMFSSLKQAFEEDKDGKFVSYARILYNQALLIEGLPIEDPADFANMVCDLM